MEIKEDSIAYPLPSNELIEEKEKKWHLVLLQDYKAFVMSYNGGEPVQDSFSCDGYEYGIDRFLCILKNARESEYGIYDISVVDTQIGEMLTDNEELIGIEVLPIAELYGGDMVCLDFRENPDSPTVCIWDSEESDEFEPVTYEIAKSFTEFYDMLYEE